MLKISSHLHGVGAWVALSKVSLTLGPGQSKNVAFGLFIPHNTTSGQHIGGIVAENMSLQNTPSIATNGNIKINLRLKKLYALPIVVNIPGRVREQLAASGAMLDNASPYQRILIGLANTGNMILYPKGTATIIDSRGNIVQMTKLTINAFLPHTSIKYPLNITGTALPVGTYRIKFLLNYGKYTPATLSTLFHFFVKNPEKSLATLASRVVVPGPIDFLRSLALWQYALAGIVLLLVGSALFFWMQKMYTMLVNVRHKGGGREITPG